MSQGIETIFKYWNEMTPQYISIMILGKLELNKALFSTFCYWYFWGKLELSFFYHLCKRWMKVWSIFGWASALNDLSPVTAFRNRHILLVIQNIFWGTINYFMFPDFRWEESCEDQQKDYQQKELIRTRSKLSLPYIPK